MQKKQILADSCTRRTMGNRYVGTRVPPREDVRFLTGRGQYIDDLKLPGMLYASILRSPYAHALIKSIDTSSVLDHQGVAAVLTGTQAAKLTVPVYSWATRVMKQYCLATDKVRFVGEPVVAIAASTRAEAEEALEYTKLEYEPLKAVVDIDSAVKPGAPLVWADFPNNIILKKVWHYGDVEAAFAESDFTINEKLRIHRYSSTPLECYGCIASYDPSSHTLTIWSNSQHPGRDATFLSEALRIPQHRVRIIIPDSGGGFGNKLQGLRYQIIASLLSMETSRPVKWIESRIEHLMALCHKADEFFDVEAACTKDGKILGLRIKDFENSGSDMGFAGFFLQNKVKALPGPYRARHLLVEGTAVATNKGPIGPDRGVAKPSAAFIYERMMDLVARKLNLDRAEIRRRNFIQPNEFPYRSPTRELYGSGNYPEALQTALTISGYPHFTEDERVAKEGRHIGIGLATFVHAGTPNYAADYISTRRTGEGLANSWTGLTLASTIKVSEQGKVTVLMSAAACGQGWETASAQVVADELKINMDDVNVIGIFDSLTHPTTGYSGSFSNTFQSMMVGSIVGAAKKVKEKVLRIAARILSSSPKELIWDWNGIYVRSNEEKRTTFHEVAFVANRNLFALSKDIEPGLHETCYYIHPEYHFQEPDAQGRTGHSLTWGIEVHVATVQVDVETGKVEVLRYAVVSDSGNIINPIIVEGMAHGSTIHGIGAALGGEFIYDENGQPLTTTFMDLIKPTAVECPEVQVKHMGTADPFTVLGTKGAGEGGSTPAPAAIASAVEDALSSYGVKVTALPLTPEKVWNLIRQAGHQ
ncbi:MAG: xanthine dehydrogenase family protein molybdopterin-binding subunit [Thaumarchaeota archaeon]|nr:xanthine dehydrogenase family protein molybdopterin-binding subunit [Nitrososphaerota archaeon]